MRKKVIETYKGMNQDIAPNKFPEGFYYSANNIKIAPAEESQSQFQVTNRKASSLQYTFTSPYISSGLVKFDIDDVPTNSRMTAAQATYLSSSGLLTATGPSELTNEGLVGYVEVDDFSIVVMDFGDVQGVFKLSDSTVELLYVDDLGLTFGTNFADLKYYFETESIEKLYIAVEGQLPLYFNITSGQTYGLKGNHEIIPDITFGTPAAEKSGNGGYHTSGVIQYAYSAYYRNGASSTISPLSELIPLVDSNGNGKAVNEYIGQVNAVTIPQVDNFDYIKVYSIKYNESTDIPIISVILDTSNPTQELIIYDDNVIINTISAEEFLFLGGTIIKPSTIEIKDNRMFAGNLSEDSFDINIGLEPGDSGYFDTRAYRFQGSSSGTAEISDIDGTTKQVNRTTFLDGSGQEIPIDYDCTNEDFTYNYNTTVYPTSPLFTPSAGAEGKNIKVTLSSTSSSDDTKRLKFGEIYRYGVRFINSKGQRSPVHWICDIKTPYPFDLSDHFKVDIQVSNQDLLYNQGAVGLEFMRVLRGEADKSIVAQGIAGTMMFQLRTLDTTQAGNTRSTGTFNYSGGAGTTVRETEAYYYREEYSKDVVFFPTIIPKFPATISTPLTSPTGNSKASFQKLKHVGCLSLADQDVAYAADDVCIYDFGGFGGLGSDSYLDDFDGEASGTAYTNDQYEEISSGSLHYDEANRTNRTYQYTKMWQVFSPDIEFSNISLSGVNTISVIANLPVTDYAGAASSGDYTTSLTFARSNAKEYVISTGVIKEEDSVYPGILYDTVDGFHGISGSYGMLSKQASDQMDKYMYSFLVPKSEVQRFNTINDYSIFGTPELAPIGTVNKAYNGNLDYVYSTSLYDVGSDDLELLHLYSNTNKSAILIPLRKETDRAATATFVEASKRNHLPLEDAIYYGVTDGANLIFPDADYKPGFTLVEFKRDLPNQYGGSTYEARSLNKYIPMSEYVTVASTGSQVVTVTDPGDVYWQYYDMAHSTYDSPDLLVEKTIMQGVHIKFPVETSINLNTRYDLYGNISSGSFYDGFIQPFENLSKYNTVYNREPDVFVSTPRLFSEPMVTSRNNIIRASKTKVPGETIDSFTDFLTNEELAVDGKYGSINRLYNYNDEILCFQKNGVSLLSINPRVTTMGEDGIQTELGTGKVLDRYKYLSTKYGVNSKDVLTIKYSRSALYFYDRSTKALCRMQGPNIANLGMARGMNNPIKDSNGIVDYVFNSSVNKDTNEYHFSRIDHNKISGTSSSDIVFNELLDAFTHYDTNTNKLWNLSSGNAFYSFDYDTTGLTPKMYYYQMYNHATDYLPCEITYLLNPTQGLITCRFDNIQWYSYAEVPSTGLEDVDETFTNFIAQTDYQLNSGSFASQVALYKPKRKFRQWRVPFPRSGRDRFRAPHMYWTFKYSNTNKYFKWGDLVISYNI